MFFYCILPFSRPPLPLSPLLCFPRPQRESIFGGSLKAWQIYQPNNLQDQIKEGSKMQIQSLTSALSLSTFIPSLKVHSSMGTEATTDDLFRKKISLCSCSSSISLEQDLAHSKEKELFGKYLFSQDLGRQHSLFTQMQQLYQEHLLHYKNEGNDLFQLECPGDEPRPRVLAYFVGIWLKHMGYGTEKNKRYLLGRVKLFFGHASLRQFTRIYQDLNLLNLPCLEKLDFLLATCRNGWEFFIQEIRRNSPSLLLAEYPDERRERGHLQPRK